MEMVEAWKHDHDALRKSLKRLQWDLHMIADDSAALRETYQAIIGPLREHIRNEEDALRPRAQRISPEAWGALSSMHARQHRLSRDIDRLLGKRRVPTDQLTSRLTDFVHELREDFAKEEREYFPAVENVATAAASPGDPWPTASVGHHEWPSPRSRGQPATPRLRHQHLLEASSVMACGGLLGLWLIARAARVDHAALFAGPAASFRPPVFAAAGGPAWSPKTLEPLRHLMVQDNNRLISLESFSRDALRRLFGKTRGMAADPLQVMLSMVADPERWQTQPCIRVDRPATRQQLGLDPAARYASFADMMANPLAQRALAEAQQKQQRRQRLSPVEQELLEVSARCLLLRRLFEQELQVVPPALEESKRWLPVLRPDGYITEQQVGIKRCWGTLLHAVRVEDASAITATAERLAGLLKNLHAQHRGLGKPL